jgi:hypothetical protein
VVGLVLIYAFFGICGTCCKSAMMLNLASFLGVIALIIVMDTAFSDLQTIIILQPITKVLD